MIWLAFAIALFYFWAIVLLYIGYTRVPYFSVLEKPAETKFSVIVPFRDEAENLPELLRSFQQLNYPTTHFEFLFINDHSSDISEEIIRQTLKDSQLNYRVLQNTPNQPSPKKTAITLAIEVSGFSWLITTDADCSVPENWLRILNDYIITKTPICVAMPVDYDIKSIFLNRYQQLDNWSLQGVTIGSYGLGNILLSNGANFAYQKDAFYAVDGFKGNLHIASGDDMFLLEKFKDAFPKQIGYLKSRNAIVTTQPVNSWKKVIAQRVRWASKTTFQKSVGSKALGLLVFAMNILIVIVPILAILWPQQAILFVSVVIYKLLLDFCLLRKTSQFFNKKFPFFSFIGGTLLYPIVTIFIVLSSFSGTYVWKERFFKK